MSQGAWVLIAALVLATVFGVYRAFTDGRFRGTHKIGPTPRGRARAAGRGPNDVRRSGAEPSVREPSSIEPSSIEPSGIEPSGIEPSGIDLSSIEPSGIDLSGIDPSVLEGTGIDHVLGERATMLQFSSAFCAPCRATRRILTDVVEIVPGVAHIEVDAEQHLELVRRLGILRTPTTLILDKRGREVSRATGAPKKAAVLTGLSAAVD